MSPSKRKTINDSPVASIISVRGIDYTQPRLDAAVRAALRLLAANAVADPENGGDDSTDWEDLDVAHELAKAAGRLAVSLKPSAPPGAGGEPIVRIDGHSFTRRQAFEAVVSSQQLQHAYRQGKRNGGSIEWSDIDLALESALASADDAGLARINEAARYANGYEPEDDEGPWRVPPERQTP